MQPGVLDITIHQNATFKLQLALQDGTGAALNMTGYSVAAQVWIEGKRQKLADFQLAWVNQAGGVFTLTIPAATTASMSDGRWDMLVTNPDGTKDCWLSGAVTVEPGYTS